MEEKLNTAYNEGKTTAEIYTFLNASEQLEMSVLNHNEKFKDITKFNNNLPDILDTISQNSNFEESKKIDIFNYYNQYNISMEHDYQKYLNFPISDESYCKLANKFKNENLTCLKKENSFVLKYKLFQQT